MSKTVLVVDDDEEFLSALTPLLHEAGYLTIVITDGNEALRRLQNDYASIDAAIIDLALPDVGGFHIIGTIGKEKKLMPILAITGAYSDVYLQVAQYLGAQMAVQKPRPGESLVGLVRALEKAMETKPI